MSTIATIPQMRSSDVRGGRGRLIWPQWGRLIWPHFRPIARRPCCSVEGRRESAERMRSRVELFEQIRRDREFAGMSAHALARKYGVHRRTVRQALESSVPPGGMRPELRPAPRLGEWQA